MVYLLKRTFEFSASHYMPGDPGPCGRVHGHNWSCTVTLRFEAAPKGMTMNALDLDPMIEAIKFGNRNAMPDVPPEAKVAGGGLDHANLNDYFSVPSLEVVAAFIFRVFKARWPETHSVYLSEGLGIAVEVTE